MKGAFRSLLALIAALGAGDALAAGRELLRQAFAHG
jgi:hypothetical protein